MALQAVYKQFLAAPNSSLLAGDASLHYVTTTTSYNGATEIIKHLSSQRNHIKKKKEDILDVVEGHNAVAVQTETCLEFISSGGAYLPGLDDNFLADRTVHIAVTHIVSFDHEGKIARIRQSWDQGSLLKQLDVIGKTGRNWPIRDSQEQIKLIIRSSGKPAEGTTTEVPVRSRGNSTNVMRGDSQTTLNLFAPRDHSDLPASVVSPYAGSRPHQRSFTDILGDEPEEVGSPSGGRERSQSPSKAIAPKIGASKKFQPPRLFEESEDKGPSEANTPEGKSSDRFYRPHPKKYSHFDFADGSEPADAPKAGVAFHEMPKGKHGSAWDFQDFVTPQKPQSGRVRQQQVRHWDTEETEDQEPTAKKPVVAKPRRDAETHFELQDDGLPSGQPRPTRPRGATHNEGLGLYKNHMVSDDGTEPPATPDPRTLTNITNLKDRSKIFDPHFDMNDESPHASPPKHTSQISDDRAKAVKMMESNWSAYDESPASQKENNNPTKLAASKDRKENGPNHRIVIAGDGMGNKKGGRGWSIGDASDEENTGIVTAGDGMGNKKGGRGWSIGDESDEEKAAPAVPGKKRGAQAKAGGSFWDF